MWEKYNPNPDTRKYLRGRKKGEKVDHYDCVIRAFTLLFNLDWQETYMKLVLRGLEKYDIFTVPEVYTTFLDKVPTPKKSVDSVDDPRESRNFTVREIAELTKGNRQVLLCSTLHHVVVCKNGKYYDSWNSGHVPVRSLWKLKEEYR